MRGTLGPWYVDTPRSPAEIAAFLRAYAPWRMALEFPGGLRSEDYGRMEPWNNVPTRKAQLFADIIPEETLRGQRILDVGSNSGHSALYLFQEFGCIATGIDFDKREVERAQWIADALGAPARFLVADAETYEEPEAYAVVLHFGTLYHLPNPIRALMSSFRSLQPGGWLALESACYVSNEPMAAKMIHGWGGDPTNFWALGKGALEKVLSLAGFDEIQLIEESHPTIYASDLSRVIYSARKPR